jgi:hypothetical protein
MADSGGYNPGATLLSENPGADLKVFAGGGIAVNEVGAVAEGGYDNSATLLRAPADPLPVVKFSGGGDDFNFVNDVLGLTEPITELNGITTLDAIKELTENTLNPIYENLLENDVKFAEFIKKKGFESLISENHQAVGDVPTDAESKYDL